MLLADNLRRNSCIFKRVCSNVNTCHIIMWVILKECMVRTRSYRKLDQQNFRIEKLTLDISIF